MGQTKQKSRLKSRLRKSDWLATGLKVLAEDGPPALRAEALARRIGTTKGSFYWHFADVPDFHAALIAHWEDGARRNLITAEDDTPPATVLRSLACTLSTDPIEPALRAWAMWHEGAAQSLARIDAARLDRLSSLLRQIGVTNADMAHLLQNTATGTSIMSQGETGAARMGTLVDLILALR